MSPQRNTLYNLFSYVVSIYSVIIDRGYVARFTNCILLQQIGPNMNIDIDNNKQYFRESNLYMNKLSYAESWKMSNKHAWLYSLLNSQKRPFMERHSWTKNLDKISTLLNN